MKRCLSFCLFVHCCYAFFQLLLYLRLLVCLDVGLNTIVSVTYNKQLPVTILSDNNNRQKILIIDDNSEYSPYIADELGYSRLD